MTRLIEEWWDQGESEVSTASAPASTARTVTSALALPSPLASGTNFSTLTWPLDVIDSSLEKAVFTIEIQQFDVESYQLRNPKLKTACRRGSDLTLYWDAV